MTRRGVQRRRSAALVLAAVGALLAVAALGPAATSAAWQDRVLFSSDVSVVPGVGPDEVDAGAGFSCTLVAADMWCWGEGSDGQLGVGSTADSDVPVSAPSSVMDLGNGDHVSGGKQYACGAAGGRAFCWGAGGGRLGNFDVAEPWQTPSVTSPVPVYDLPAGSGNQYQSPLAGQVVREVDAGEYITCAVTIAGSAACWGQAVQLTRPPSGPTSWANAPIAVPTAAQDAASQLPVGARITTLATDFQNACFVADAVAYCWGRNQEGELGNGTAGAGTDKAAPVRVAQGEMPARARVTAITTGTFHTCAVADARVFCWGLRSGDLIGDNEGQTNTQNVPSAVVGLEGRTIVAVSAGDKSSCALDSTGQAYCWGSNAHGQLGNPSVPTYTTAPIPVPVSQPVGVRFVAISVGFAHVCAIGDDHAVYCWGAAGTLGTAGGQVDTLAPAVPVTPSWSSP